MKTFIRLLALSAMVITLFSCTPLAVTPSVSLKISLPASSSRAVTPDDVEIVKITVTDSAGTEHPAEIRRSVGNTETITDIALGQAHIAALAYAADGTTLLYTAETDCNIVAGNNTVMLEMEVYNPSGPGTGEGTETGEGIETGEGTENTNPPAPQTYTITLIAGRTTQDLSTGNSLTANDFSNVADKGTLGGLRTFLYWMDSNGSPINLTSNETVNGWVSQVNSNVTLKAKYGVYFDNLSTYLSNTDIWDNLPADPTTEEAELIAELKDVYVLKGDATATKIPNYSSRNAKATGITLNFEECTNLTSIDSNAFIAQNNRWCDVLKLPNTVYMVQNIKYVNKAVYVQLPVNYEKLVFYSSAQYDDSSYALHFAGTVADWCARVKLDAASNTCTEFFMDVFANQNNTQSFYFLDSNGAEYCLMSKDGANDRVVEIENTYKACEKIDNVWTVSDKSLTAINKYALRYLKCKEIYIPDTVTEIGDYAFENCYAEKVYFGDNVVTMGKGALFYGNIATTYDATRTSSTAYASRITEKPRKVYFNGTFDKWLGIVTPSGDPGDTGGGPLRGASALYVVKEGDTDYSSVVDNDGYITINVEDGKTLTLNHQLQGFKAAFKLKNTGAGTLTIGSYAFANTSSMTEIKLSGTYSLGNYCFNNCSALAAVDMTVPTAQFNNNVFGGTNVISSVTLYGDASSYCTTNPFPNTAVITLNQQGNDYAGSYSSVWGIDTTDVTKFIIITN